MCSIEVCPTEKVAARGWCSKHYRRWKLYGDPLLAGPKATALEARQARESEGFRVCRKCDELLPLEDFPRYLDGRSFTCLSCNRSYYHANRDRFLAGKASRNYLLTVEQYEELMADPNCHICGASESSSGRRLHIDHCHDTDVVRGLLCHACNTALGLLAEDPVRIKALLSYLEERSSGFFGQLGQESA